MGQMAGVADEHPQLDALGGQRPRHMVAYKTRRACKKYLHSSEQCSVYNAQ
jgi:hypothetical protein